MFGLGFGEIVIVLAIVLLFFGGKKLPELGKALGKSMNNFKKGLKDTGEGKSEKIDPPHSND
jgi:sec-independent protein translocase protein TatA